MQGYVFAPTQSSAFVFQRQLINPYTPTSATTVSAIAGEPLPIDPPSKRTNPAKVRRAAVHPDRPGAGCKPEPGVLAPILDHARCEGKGDGVEVCPDDVFEVERIATADYRPLPCTVRLEVRVHGMKTAYTPRADLCLACGLCVVACPESAIRPS